MIAQVLRNMSLFIDGRGYAGKVTEVTPPALAIKTNEFRPGGFDAAIDVDVGMEKMELSCILAEFSPDVMKLFGLVFGGRVAASLRGAARDGNGLPSAIEIAMRGTLTKMDHGTWKAGDQSAMKLTFALDKYTYRHNGTNIIMIDVENMVRMINGVDQLAADRAALGL